MRYLQFFLHARRHNRIPKEFGYVNRIPHTGRHIMPDAAVGLILKNRNNISLRLAYSPVIGYVTAIPAADIVGPGRKAVLGAEPVTVAGTATKQ